MVCSVVICWNKMQRHFAWFVSPQNTDDMVKPSLVCFVLVRRQATRWLQTQQPKPPLLLKMEVSVTKTQPRPHPATSASLWPLLQPVDPVKHTDTLSHQYSLCLHHMVLKTSVLIQCHTHGLTVLTTQPDSLVGWVCPRCQPDSLVGWVCPRCQPDSLLGSPLFHLMSYSKCS